MVVGSTLAEIAVESVEAVVHRSFAGLGSAESPFAEDGGLVAGGFEVFGDGRGACREGHLAFGIVWSEASFFFVTSDWRVALMETSH